LNRAKLEKILEIEKDTRSKALLLKLTEINRKEDSKLYNKVYAQYYRQKNPEVHRKNLQRYYYKNPKKILEKQKKYRLDRQVMQKRKQMFKRRIELYHLEIFDYIGNRKCCICSNKDPDVLELEYVGPKDKREYISIFNLYHRVRSKNEDIKKNFRVICANCHLKKRRSS